MRRSLILITVVCGVLVRASVSSAAEPGKATGTFTYGSTTVSLAHAVSVKVENLFDSAKKDTLVVLTDKPLGATPPDDDIELSLRARTGDITALALRIDGARLVNVAVFHKGLAGKSQLPGAWFQYTGSAPGAGSLKLAAREVDGNRYACAVEFAAAPRSAASPAVTAAPAPATVAPEPTPPPSTTSNIDKKSLTALLIQALMQEDEHQALEIVKLGVDPNSRDQSGTPVLNWAVMMCQPLVVKALVDKKADLTYQHAPGMTILAEAGACPDAAKILRAAGAR